MINDERVNPTPSREDIQDGLRSTLIYMILKSLSEHKQCHLTDGDMKVHFHLMTEDNPLEFITTSVENATVQAMQPIDITLTYLINNKLIATIRIKANTFEKFADILYDLFYYPELSLKELQSNADLMVDLDDDELIMIVGDGVE